MAANGATTFTVTAKDGSGNVAIGYRGTIQFTSTDPSATLPSAYTFAAEDNGVHTFTTARFFTAGSQTITAKDTVTATITATATVTVSASAASALTVSGQPATSNACTAFNLTVDAKDPYGNEATTYTGPVTFSSSDAQATLPASGSLASAHGVFAVTLHTAGSATVTVVNGAGGTVTSATAPAVTVTACATASKLKLASVAGAARTNCALDSPTITAQDAWGNTVAGYRGTVAFTSSDAAAVLPAAYAFVAADNGVHTFTNGVRLPTIATSSVTVTDTANGTINAVESGISVTACTVTCGGGVPCVPGAPGAISGPSTSTTGSYTLSWGAATGSVDHYELWENGVSIVSTAALSAALTNRADNTVFAYKVRACNANGCGDFDSAFGVTTLFVPGSPTISVPAESGSSYTVTWSPGSGVITSYTVDESTSPNVWTSLPATTEMPPPTAMGFANKATGTYSYRVKACNASGCSAPSAVASVQVVPPNLSSISDDPLTSVTVPVNQAVGTIPASPGVEGGAATYEIPIEVPPGRAGMQPSLSLTYSSKGSNGVAGVGWSLSGTGGFYTCPNTLAQDGAGRTVQHDGLDRICYNGQRLVLVAGTYGAQNSEYRTEIDSFDRITLKNGPYGNFAAYLQVEHKSGHISQYEQANSGATAFGDDYHLVREFDPQGNCVSYQYTQQMYPDDSEWRLDKVVYTSTGSGTTCTANPSTDTSLRVVQFDYNAQLFGADARPDRRRTYAYNAPNVMASALSGITTYVGGTFVRRYDLHYHQSAATQRLLLDQVRLCADAGCATALPPLQFTYQEDTSNFQAWHARAAGLNGGAPLPQDWRTMLAGDLDGDGIRELVFAQDTGARYFQLSSCGATAALDSTSILGLDNTYDLRNFGGADLDEDGRVDLFGRSATTGDLVLSDLGCVSNNAAVIASRDTGLAINAGQFVGGIDYDGDGITDIEEASGAGGPGWVMLRRDKDPTVWTHSQPIALAPFPTGANMKMTMMRDMNGDGRVDTVFEDSGSPAGQHVSDMITFFTGIDGTGHAIYASYNLETLGGPSAAWLDHPARRWIDVNGDGLPDVFDPDTNAVYINRGGVPRPTMFEMHTLTGFSEIWQRSEASFTMDVDNDGQEELMVPSYRTLDYCGGNPHVLITNAYFDSQPAMFCGDEFDQDGIPKQWISFDHSVFAWNAYRFVE